MGFKDWLADLLAPPCLHEWEKVSDLASDDGKAVTLIRMCKHCGEVRKETFEAPPSKGCPPHLWGELTDGKPVYDPGKSGKVDRTQPPNAYIYRQSCRKCGEVRTYHEGPNGGKYL